VYPSYPQQQQQQQQPMVQSGVGVLSPAAESYSDGYRSGGLSGSGISGISGSGISGGGGGGTDIDDMLKGFVDKKEENGVVKEGGVVGKKKKFGAFLGKLSS
jgi:hypothetical protein